jgi:hypothetical protein
MHDREQAGLLEVGQFRLACVREQPRDVRLAAQERRRPARGEQRAAEILRLVPEESDEVVLFNTGTGLKYLDTLDTKRVEPTGLPTSRQIAGIIGPY